MSYSKKNSSDYYHILHIYLLLTHLTLDSLTEVVGTKHNDLIV